MSYNTATNLAEVVVLYVCCTTVVVKTLACGITARTESGWVCGVRRESDADKMYASFRGVPYAKQPLGALRFKELQPAEPWTDMYNATMEGPVCPQNNIFFGPLMQPQGMSEACIHANIHVPIKTLTTDAGSGGSGSPEPLLDLVQKDEISGNENGLPVLVFIHGGGFACGSGDDDMYGPEYLVSKGVIVITFNYRINVFGYLSLNTSSIPGNNGLRDHITLLRWVQRNVKHFGGDPDNVTLLGHSAGSASTHLLSLSPAAVGLFKRIIMVGGIGSGGFFSSKPEYARDIASRFITALGIQSTDPEEIHRQLIDMPLEKIMEANTLMESTQVSCIFNPVVEHPHPGVTIVLDDDPLALVTKGRGKDIPMMVGFAMTECAVFQERFESIDVLKILVDNPTFMLNPSTNFTILPEKTLQAAMEVERKYFNGELSMEKLVEMCSDAYFIHPTFKLAELRMASGGAPVFMFQFSYRHDDSLFRMATDIDYEGATHTEDLSYIFKMNTIVGDHKSFPPVEPEDVMKDWMTTFVVNFMRCSDPTCNKNDVSLWPPEEKQVKYQDISQPSVYRYVEPTEKQKDAMKFFDDLIRNYS